MNKHARKSNKPPPPPPPEVSVQSMTTASNTWLSRYLVVDKMLGMPQALVPIVTANC